MRKCLITRRSCCVALRAGFSIHLIVAMALVAPTSSRAFDPMELISWRDRHVSKVYYVAGFRLLW